MTARHALYSTRVMHMRTKPRRYRFVYRTFCLLLDVDALDRTGCRLLSHNRFNLFSVHDRDHGSRGAEPLRGWAERLLRARGIHLEGGPIRLLCMPRVLGYGFNPLSLWYCHHRDGTLRAVIAEVRNTFGEKHQYLLHAGGRPLRAGQAWEADKRFHVSPFIGMQAVYRFHADAPAERLRVLIDEYQDGERLLVATLGGTRRPLTDGGLLWQFLRVPFLSLKVMWLIHWHALKFFLQGVRRYRKPAALDNEVTEAWQHRNG